MAWENEIRRQLEQMLRETPRAEMRRVLEQFADLVSGHIESPVLLRTRGDHWFALEAKGGLLVHLDTARGAKLCFYADGKPKRRVNIPYLDMLRHHLLAELRINGCMRAELLRQLRTGAQ